MRASVDTVVYTSAAEDLLNGKLPNGREIFYSSYILLLSALSLFRLGVSSIVYVHFLAAIVAIFCTYKLALRLTDRSRIAVLAPTLYILWFKFQQWNLVLYTDALFSHMVIISIYALLSADSTKKKIALIPLIIFTCFIRPTGLGLLLSAVVFLARQVIQVLDFNRIQKVICALGLSLFSLWFMNQVLAGFIDSFLESYQVAEVIYPNIQVLVDQPSYLNVPNADYPPLARLFLFGIQNPIYFLKLSAVKGILFLGHIKPYYSIGHNVLIGLFLYPVYVLAVRGYFNLKESSTKWMFLTFILFQVLTVCMTSENWDGRFLLPILPPIFVLSSLGAAHYIKKLTRDTTIA